MGNSGFLLQGVNSPEIDFLIKRLQIKTYFETCSLRNIIIYVANFLKVKLQSNIMGQLHFHVRSGMQ